MTDESHMSPPSPAAEPRLYADLAHYWPLLSPPEDYEAEAALVRDALEHYLPAPPDDRRPKLLELGAGGGHTLVYLLDAYDTTAADLSDAMLANCRALAPSIKTVIGDMRTLRLGCTVDAVLAHDAIDYMTTIDDLRAAMHTAAAHLAPGGLFIVAPTYVAESFANHEIASDYHEDQHTEATLVSHVRRTSETTIELALTVTLREDGHLRVEEDRHTCGLFDMATWLSLLDEAGLELLASPDDDDDEDEASRMFVAAKRP